MMIASTVDRVLDRAVDAGEVPGVVALVADDRGIVYEGAFGQRTIGVDAPMTCDSVMSLASMTKPVTAVAALQLVERGAISLDEPASRYAPELGAIQVLEGFDADGAPRLRAPQRPITLRHLLTHTAGFTYDLWNADMLRYLEYAGIPSIGECKIATLRTPLICDPGDCWEYGINLDWVGQLVERVSGQSLEAYFRAHIFDPLGMADTGFVIQPEWRTRLACTHARLPNGALMPIPFEVTQQPEFLSGGIGLYSTGADYLRFLRMLLGDGQFDGTRVLQPETVAEMGRNQIGNLAAGVLKSVVPAMSNDFELFPGITKGWGLGAMIVPTGTPSGRGAGSQSWAGLANTYFWIDPARRVTGVLLTQVLPSADPIVIDLLAQFEAAIYASFVR